MIPVGGCRDAAPAIFFTRPIAAPLMVIAIVLFLLPLVNTVKNAMRRRRDRAA